MLKASDDNIVITDDHVSDDYISDDPLATAA